MQFDEGAKEMVRETGGNVGARGGRRDWSLGSRTLDSKPTFRLDLWNPRESRDGLL